MSDDPDGDESIQFVQDADTESIQFIEDTNNNGTPLLATGEVGKGQRTRPRSNSRLTFKTDDDVVLGPSAQDDCATSVSSAPGGGWFVSGNTDGDDSAGEAVAARGASRSSMERRTTQAFNKKGSAASTGSIQFGSLRSGVDGGGYDGRATGCAESVVDNGSIAFTIEDSNAPPSPDAYAATSSKMSASGRLTGQGNEKKKKTVVSTVLRDRGGSVARQMRQRAAAQAASVQLPLANDGIGATSSSAMQTNAKVEIAPSGGGGGVAIVPSKESPDEFCLEFPPLRTTSMPAAPLDSLHARRSSSQEQRAGSTGSALASLVSPPAAAGDQVVHARTSSKQLVLAHLLEQEASNAFVQKASSTLVQQAASGPTPSKQRQSQVTLSFPPPAAAPLDTPMVAAKASPPPPPAAVTEDVRHSLLVSWIGPDDIEAAKQVAENMRMYKEVQREELRIMELRVRQEQRAAVLALSSSPGMGGAKKKKDGQQGVVGGRSSSPMQQGRLALDAIAAAQQMHQHSSYHAAPLDAREQMKKKTYEYAPPGGNSSNSARHQHMTSSAVMKRAPSAQPVLVVPKVVIRSSGDANDAPAAVTRHILTGAGSPNLVLASSPYGSKNKKSEKGKSRAFLPADKVAADYAKQVRKEKQDAYQATAQSFGIVWPPSSHDGTLYFISGVRLTESQTNQFYCAAEERHRHLSESAGGGVQAVPPRGLDFLLLTSNKQQQQQPHNAAAMTPSGKLQGHRRKDRTSVLRDVFHLLDMDRRGFLISADLLSLRGLMLAEMDEVAAAGGSGDTLLRAAEQAKTTSHHALPSSLARHARLCEFAADVVIPLLVESGSPQIDFPLFAMIVQQKLKTSSNVSSSVAAAAAANGNRTGDMWQAYADGFLEELRCC